MLQPVIEYAKQSVCSAPFPACLGARIMQGCQSVSGHGQHNLGTQLNWIERQTANLSGEGSIPSVPALSPIRSLVISRLNLHWRQVCPCGRKWGEYGDIGQRETMRPASAKCRFDSGYLHQQRGRAAFSFHGTPENYTNELAQANRGGQARFSTLKCDHKPAICIKTIHMIRCFCANRHFSENPLTFCSICGIIRPQRERGKTKSRNPSPRKLSLTGIDSKRAGVASTQSGRRIVAV